MISYRMSRDFNGNKTVMININHYRGFSIQTTGNLPKTHRSGKPDQEEINAWINTYGTLNQRMWLKETLEEDLNLGGVK